jgi:hypothetical protein
MSNVRCSLVDELLKYPSDDGDFFFRPWQEPHTVRFQALHSPFASLPFECCLKVVPMEVPISLSGLDPIVAEIIEAHAGTAVDNDNNKRRRLVEFKDGCRYGNSERPRLMN